ncbi:MAG: hypothetical protein ACREOH_13770, partial [Candidatus Entotheonellia bacterium]
SRCHAMVGITDGLFCYVSPYNKIAFFQSYYPVSKLASPALSAMLEPYGIEKGDVPVLILLRRVCEPPRPG